MEHHIMRNANLLRAVIASLFVLLFIKVEAAVAPPNCVANAGPDQTVCAGNCVTIGADTTIPGNIYEWYVVGGSPATSLSDSTVAQPTVCPNTTFEEYVFVVTDPILMCSDTDTVAIFRSQPFNFTRAWSDSSFCQGQEITFDYTLLPAGSDYVFNWGSNANFTYPDPSLQFPTIAPTTSGTYFVTVTDTLTNCSSVIPFNLTIDRLNVIATPPGKEINPGQRVQLDAFATDGVGEVVYVWSPNTYLSCTQCQNPVAMPPSSISYTVTATDSEGCQGTATVVLSADSLLIPNVFTPNGDGINDVLTLNYFGDGVYEILIFDRWGRQVFATKDKQVFWDGRVNGGEPAPEGVYYMAVRIIGDPAIPEDDKQRAFAINLIR